MVFQLKAVAYGLGALLALGGIVFIALGYNKTPANGDEVNAGWILIGISVVMWVVGFISKEAKKHHWH